MKRQPYRKAHPALPRASGVEASLMGFDGSPGVGQPEARAFRPAAEKGVEDIGQIFLAHTAAVVLDVDFHGLQLRPVADADVDPAGIVDCLDRIEKQVHYGQ